MGAWFRSASRGRFHALDDHQTDAKADLSLARCWEGHANSLVLLDGIATRRRRRFWFEGVVATRREMGGVERRASIASARGSAEVRH